MQELLTKATWRREEEEKGGKQLVDEWKEFRPKMETSLFRTTVIVNECHPVKALIDDGCSGYATINGNLSRKLKLPQVPITPRSVSGVLDKMSSFITNVVAFNMDVGGLKTEKAWAYVVERQQEDLIIGRPWLLHHQAILNPAKSRISFTFSDVTIRSDDNLLADPKSAANTMKITQVTASTFAGLAKRSKKASSEVELFAATLADIEKALRVKPRLSLDEIIQKLPPHYRSFASVFDPNEASKLPPHRPGLDHEIPIEKDEFGRDRELPWGQLYNMSHDELLVLRKELTCLLQNQFIRESKSPAAAPVLFARKPGGGLRFCVDYRGLNAITRKDRYPLPLIRETLSALSKAKWLTKLDVTAAFHKIRMAKGEEWKTAFRTRYGLFEWNVCPFGLTGSPATFQRYINWTLRDFLDDFCSAYVDDILVFSSGSLTDHRTKVKAVLQRLMENGLYLDISKCEFETTTTKYLGYIIEANVGIKMDPEKVNAIRHWKQLTTMKGARSFLGFANYYRMFIKDYARIAEPLHDLTKKEKAFLWGTPQKEAFESLKQAFLNGPVLSNYDPERKTQLETDASGWASGGVLSQYNTALQTWKPVAFYSARHSPAECNYDIHDKELLAVVKCAKEWSSELRGLSQPFTILSDHRNLETFMKKRTLNERQVRWAEFLSQFHFQLKHRPGLQAVGPDALSRRDQDVPAGHDDTRIAERRRVLLSAPLLVNVDEIQKINLPCPFLDDTRLQELWNEALLEPKIGQRFRRAYATVQQHGTRFPADLELRLATGECDVTQGLLRYRERLWLPNYEPLTTRIIQTTHDSFLAGHPGRDATIALLCRKFFWPGINQDVRRFVRNCEVCGRTTIWRDKKKGLLKPLPIPKRVWQEISMDFITGLPPSENDCTTLLVITDRLGKGTILIPVPPRQFDAKSVAKLFFRHYVPFHWLPRGIVSDRGSQFVNALWNTVCGLLKINQRLSTAYHPETDGSTERRNQEIETYLRAFVAYEQTDWVQWLPVAQIALDNRPAASTGISPFFLIHGYDANVVTTTEDRSELGARTSPRIAGQDMVEKLHEAQEFAQSAMAVAQQTQEHHANKQRDVPFTFKEGDKVWLNLKNIATERPSRKLDWIHAKYSVTRTFQNNAHFYELDVPSRIHKKFHVSLLRPAGTDPLPSQSSDKAEPPPIISTEGDEMWLIDEILKARTRRHGRGSRREVLVKWKGYDEPSWEPLTELQDSEAVAVFERLYGDLQTHDGPKEGGER